MKNLLVYILILTAFFVSGSADAQKTTKEKKAEDPYVLAAKEFLKLPQADAENNGLQEYIYAFEKYNGELYQKNNDDIKKMLLSDTFDKNSQVVNHLLKNNQVMALVLKGNGKKIIKYPKWQDLKKKPSDLPLPDFSILNQINNTLILQGMYYVMNNKMNSALATYETALIFSERLGGESCATATKLASFEYQMNVLKKICALILSGKLDARQYDLAVKILCNYSPSEKPAYLNLIDDLSFARWQFENFDSEGGMAEFIKSNDEKNSAKIDEFRKNKQKEIGDLDTLGKEIAKVSLLSFKEIMNFDAGKFLDKDMQRYISPNNFKRVIIMETYLKAYARMIAIAGDVKKYQLAEKKFPENIMAIGIMEETMKDPFTGEKINYIYNKDKQMIYSFGPDLNDDKGDTEFKFSDALANKSLSGDIVIKLK